MSISALRLAITTAAGTPTQFTHVGLLRELITAWGGTPTQWSILPLLREAIVKVGGTPTQNTQTGLLRELVTALGGSPVDFINDDLWAQVAARAASGAPGAGFATPTLSNFSTLGAAPIVLQGSTADYVAGYRGQLQIATDSGFATITQNIIFFIDGNSWASKDIGIALVSPTGTYDARWRVLRDNESGTTVTGNDPLGNALSFGADIGPWSNTFTDTIVSSVAAFPSANGVDKNANIATSGSPRLTFLGSGGVGAYCSTRVQVQAQSDLTQWEMTLNAIGASDNVYMGVGTNATSFVGFQAPGLTDATGVAVKIQANQITMNWNTDGSAATLSTTSGVAAISDVFALLLKKSTNQLSVFRTRSGVTVQIGTTQTIPAFASYYAYVSTRQAWGGTCNFGGTAFARALGGGEAIYG